MTQIHHPDKRLLRLNIGFLLKQGAGYSRDILFEQAEPINADDVTLHDFDGTLRLSRTPQGIVVQGKLKAKTLSACARCLTDVIVGVEVEFSELFILPSNGNAEPEQGQYLIDEGNFIDLTPIMREEAILAVPMHTVCSPECKGICLHCGQDLNEATCNCSQEAIDPRLEVLRSLLDE